MNWEIDDSKQIHLQIIEEITRRIIQGIYLPGEKIPSVRDLAMEARVNPNTMQKALLELENDKIIITKRTTGKFITEDKKLIASLNKNILSQLTHEFVSSIRSLGIDNETIIGLVEKEIKK